MIPFIMIPAYQLKFSSCISFSTWNTPFFCLLYASCNSNHFKNVYFSFSLNGEIFSVVGFTILWLSPINRSMDFFTSHYTYWVRCFLKRKKGREILDQNSFDNNSNSKTWTMESVRFTHKSCKWIKIWTMRFARLGSVCQS